MPGLLRSIAFHSWFAKVSLLAVVSITLPIANITNTSIANAAPNPIEIISITESSITSVEILFNSNLPKKQLSYYVINAAIELPVVAPQNSKAQNVSAIAPKNIKKIIKTKATGLITAEIKNLNPKAAYYFSISAKTNKGKMISTAPMQHSPLSNLMDLLSDLPADWGNPKPIQLPTPAPTSAPIAAPAFTLSSSSETRTVNTGATGFTINSTGGAIASFAINATPPGMSFNTTTGALTGTPNTVAAATNYTITATNASGSATQTFTLTVTAPLAVPAFTLSSVAETRTVNTAATGFTINSTGGAIASFAISATPAGMSFNTSTGALTGTPTSVAAATAYTVTATNASGSATQTFTLTVIAVVYTVGQTGPGGGKIFYVAPTPFACGPTRIANCTYLEVTPNNWYLGSSGGLTRRWAENAYITTRVNNSTPPETATASAIGWGYRNTRAIINQGNSNSDLSAAALADSHTVTVSGIVYDDWFLPSQDELKKLYDSLFTSGDYGDSASNAYWSSTEWSAGEGWSEIFASAYNNARYSKNQLAIVRPIRAF